MSIGDDLHIYMYMCVCVHLYIYIYMHMYIYIVIHVLFQVPYCLKYMIVFLRSQIFGHHLKMTYVNHCVILCDELQH